MKIEVIKDMPNEDYHNERGHYSSTTLKQALLNPNKFLNYLQKGSNISDSAKSFGNYIHTAILEPEKLEDECEVFSGRARKGRAWDDFLQMNLDKTVITMAELEIAEEIINRLNTDFIELEEGPIAAKDLFKGGAAEVSTFAELLGERVKCRTDYEIFDKKSNTLIIRDLKSTSSDVSTPDKARSVISYYGYDLSAALYTDIKKLELEKYHKIKGAVNVIFDLVFVSKKDYSINLYRVSESTLNKGRYGENGDPKNPDGGYYKAIKNIKKWEKNGYKEGLRYV